MVDIALEGPKKHKGKGSYVKEPPVPCGEVKKATRSEWEAEAGHMGRSKSTKYFYRRRRVSQIGPTFAFRSKSL